ncbi:Serine carboxypeptidase 3 [Acorus calamus]|uniref:Serine carboxypeptidase 3 n=1 Tax=Acorus calamus TaxID=4465 RepID=A0AAV9CPG9_ACOCL|nr:Serine carboxypeptidase 3 [Acorus calamus]
MCVIKKSDYTRINKILPVCELAIKLCGTSGTTSCLASYLVCNTIFNSIMKIAGKINIRLRHIHHVCIVDVRNWNPQPGLERTRNEMLSVNLSGILNFLAEVMMGCGEDAEFGMRKLVEKIDTI